MNKSRKTLLLLAAVSMLPVLGSLALIQWWQPTARMNHGELLETRSARLESLQTDIAATTIDTTVKRKWVLLTIQTAACDARCQNKLYLMRQVRTAQNENMLRIERVWVVADAGKPDPALLAAHRGLHLVYTTDQKWTGNLPQGSDTGAYIFLIDPLGNFVLRYDDQSLPKGMLKDLGRLLKYSAIG